MDICCKAVENPREVYNYMNTFRFPYRYGADFACWERSYAHDMDGEGRWLRGWRRSARIVQAGWRGLFSMGIPRSALTKAAR